MYISQDPIRLFGGNKLYGYVCDTNIWDDPFGLTPKCQLKDATEEDGDADVVLTISKKDFSDDNEAIEHMEDVMKAKGDIYTYQPENANAQRKASLKGHDTVPGKDRDESPMAIFKEGGSGASVRPINPSDNRSVGSAVGAALRGQDSGTKVKIVITD